MIKVKVPATSANIGPGFDCLGIAFELYNYFYVEEISNGLQIEGCNEEFNNENNLVYYSMMKCFKKLGYTPKGIRIKMECNIPISRGLGSSAACILGGIISANEIAKGNLSMKDILHIATEIEGHPDNVAPALLGGMVVSVCQNNVPYYSKINISKELKFQALIPDFKLSTIKAREVLPKTIKYEDGVFNVGRVSMLISSFINGDFDLLSIALNDRLHQLYRSKLIRNYDDITNKCRELGALGTFISGSGPTIMAITHEKTKVYVNKIKDYLDTLDRKWLVKSLEVDFCGSRIKKY